MSNTDGSTIGGTLISRREAACRMLGGTAGLVIGSQLMAARPPAVREALRDLDTALFNFSFESSLRGAAVSLLLGMLAVSRAGIPCACG